MKNNIHTQFLNEPGVSSFVYKTKHTLTKINIGYMGTFMFTIKDPTCYDEEDYNRILEMLQNERKRIMRIIIRFKPTNDRLLDKAYDMKLPAIKEHLKEHCNKVSEGKMVGEHSYIFCVIVD